MKKFRPRHNLDMLIAFITIAMVLLALLAGVLFAPQNTFVASADDTVEPESVNFEVIFPQNDYFQSQNPDLICANDNSLIIYDKAANKLFVRSGVQTGTYTYTLQAQTGNLKGIYALGNSAFLWAEDGKFYTLDLQDPSAIEQEQTLPTPENISYLYSDGNHLYAKSTAGRLTIYDSALQTAFDVEDLYNDLFAGVHLIMGEGQMLYEFKVDMGYPLFVSYNLKDQKSTSVNIDATITSAAIGNVIFAQMLDPLAVDAPNNKIGCIDKQSGETLFVSDIAPDQFCGFGNKLYTIEGSKINIYTLSEQRDALVKTSTLSMAGSDLKHFDSPRDSLIADGDELVVADGNNNRIAFVKAGSMQALALDSSPISLASQASDVYVALQNGKIHKLVNRQIVNTYTLDGVVDILHLDKLYAITNDGLYTFLGSRAIKITSLQSPRKLSCAEGGNNLYVMCDEQICTIDTAGTLLPTTLQGDFTTAVDFAVDYAGNFVIAEQNTVSYYKNNVLSLEQQSSVQVKSSQLDATINSITLNDGKVLFCANECFVATFQMDVCTQQNFQPYTLPSFEQIPYIFATPKEGYSPIIDASARADSATLASADTLILFEDTKWNDMTLALCGDKLIFVDAAHYESATPTPIGKTYTTIANSKLYAVPYLTQGEDVAKGASITIVSDCAGYDGGAWMIATHNDKSVFIKASDVADAHTTPPTPHRPTQPQSKVKYGRAQAERVGGVVPIFTSISDHTVLAEVVDGTKFVVLGIENGYVKVDCNGTVGYMLEKDVELEGLTTVQIVAIVLSILVMVAGMAIFVTIYAAKKKQDEKANPQ